jgi:pimeloyl-ACP methyl ester carboxylesterase
MMTSTSGLACGGLIHCPSGLVVVNPIGLEDWKAKGVPFVPVDQLYERELKTSFDSIKKYQQTTYYQALTSDMILSQPVIYEIDQIAVPTVLMIGQKDTTAIGKDRAPPEAAKTLGNYPELGRLAHERIKGSVLVPFAELGHSPQVQDPARFNKALLEQLARM